MLDTWFSSALWPFSTLGWPEQTPELAALLPGDVLVTGFDIIFFWVARMMMMGLHFMGEVPFRTVYIHAPGARRARPEDVEVEGQRHRSAGADRRATAPMRCASPWRRWPAQGRDIKLAESRVEGYRNFATKLWNAARFCRDERLRARSPTSIRERLHAAGQPLDRRRALNARPSRSTRGARRPIASTTPPTRLYHFIWDKFCDWYHRVHQADPRRRRRGGQGRDARHHRLGAAPASCICCTRSCRSSPRSCSSRRAAAASR